MRVLPGLMALFLSLSFGCDLKPDDSGDSGSPDTPPADTDADADADADADVDADADGDVSLDGTLIITSPLDGETVTGPWIEVTFEVEGCTVTRPSLGPDQCHVHRYLDGSQYAEFASEGNFGHYTPDPMNIYIGEGGSHEFKVSLTRNDGSDSPFIPEISDVVTWNVVSDSDDTGGDDSDDTGGDDSDDTGGDDSGAEADSSGSSEPSPLLDHTDLGGDLLDPYFYYGFGKSIVDACVDAMETLGWSR